MTCQNPWCPVRGEYGIEQHHLIKRSHAHGLEWRDSPENLIHLCVYCHRVLVHQGGLDERGVRRTGMNWQRRILEYYEGRPGFVWREALAYTRARDWRPALGEYRCPQCGLDLMELSVTYSHCPNCWSLLEERERRGNSTENSEEDV